jgi:Ribbon-helix-helix protein, copG family
LSKLQRLYRLAQDLLSESGAYVCCIDGMQGGRMGRKKKNMSGKIISVRVNGDELESLRKIMLATQKSASNVMREAIRQLIAPAS